MGTNEIEASGHGLAAAVLALLVLLLLSRQKVGETSFWLLMAMVVTVAWSVVLALQALGSVESAFITVTAECLRGLGWLFALTAMFLRLSNTRLSDIVYSPFGAAACSAAALPAAYYLLLSPAPQPVVVQVSFGYAIAVLNILLCEQLYRNATADSRPALNYFCLAVGALFAYDLVIYVQQIAALTPGHEWQTARGFVNAVFYAPLAVAFRWNPSLTQDGQLPRQLALRMVSLVMIAGITLVTIAGHRYVSGLGGEWAEVWSLVLVIGALTAGLMLWASPSIRARFRVGLMKTFFGYKYDYREEWLRFISTLSASAAEKVPTAAVRAVAQIVKSPAGVVWVRDEDGGDYVPLGAWRSETAGTAPVNRNSPLIRFLKAQQWVIDTEEMKRFPERYDQLSPEDVAVAGDGWWLIVPMFLGRRLLGFISLRRPWIVPGLNFEDHDLLRTVGQHVAMHIKQAETDKRLAESSQFDAYNRLTAFLMHDLNNLIAQQSLVVKNAEKFRHNPEFVDDTFDTIASSVSRMRRLMEQLSRNSTAAATRSVRVDDVVRRALARSESRRPVPSFTSDQADTWLDADPERLTVIIEHLIKNSQDATEPDGRIEVTAGREGDMVVIRISDTGCGMSPEFVSERLFRPFDSTKGSESMGIGAYQAREYSRMLGGHLEVKSELGRGTTLILRLPAGGEARAAPA